MIVISFKKYELFSSIRSLHYMFLWVFSSITVGRWCTPCWCAWCYRELWYLYSEKHEARFWCSLSCEKDEAYNAVWCWTGRSFPHLSNCLNWTFGISHLYICLRFKLKASKLMLQLSLGLKSLGFRVMQLEMQPHVQKCPFISCWAFFENKYVNLNEFN